MVVKVFGRLPLEYPAGQSARTTTPARPMAIKMTITGASPDGERCVKHQELVEIALGYLMRARTSHNPQTEQASHLLNLVYRRPLPASCSIMKKCCSYVHAPSGKLHPKSDRQMSRPLSTPALPGPTPRPPIGASGIYTQLDLLSSIVLAQVLLNSVSAEH